MDKSTFLKPDQLIPLNLNLRAKLIVEGMIAGLHKSPYHGFSAQFLEYRQYLQGESAKKIDWRKYAKTDKAVVRLFEDETNLFAHILVDKSASMGFASNGQMSRFDYARTLAASLARIFINQRDAVGMASFDESLGSYLPPRSTNIQLKNIINELNKIESGAQTHCASAVNTLAAGISKRGLCIIISDFFDDPLEIAEALRHLRFKRQDVIAIWVLDPFELNFASKATYRFQDLENGKILTLDGKTASEYFARGFTEHRQKIEQACKELQIDIEMVLTDEPFQKALFRILEKRRRMF
jgi:uncharacterized protein (DUF58 family)